LTSQPTLEEIQARLARFRDERDWGQFHRPGSLASAVSIEAAELLELFLWSSPESEAEILESRRGDVEAELADVMIQCLNFAAATGIDLLAAMARKIDENAEKYPVEKARGRSAKSSDL
jgi:dCTP diphosphatase